MPRIVRVTGGNPSPGQVDAAVAVSVEDLERVEAVHGLLDLHALLDAAGRRRGARAPAPGGALEGGADRLPQVEDGGGQVAEPPDGRQVQREAALADVPAGLHARAEGDGAPEEVLDLRRPPSR